MPQQSKRTQSELNQLAIRAAVLRWEKHRAPADIVKDLELNDDRELRRLLSRAIDGENPLVVVRVQAAGPERRTDPAVNDKLAALAKLGRALVTRVDPPTDPPLTDEKLSQELHTQVGEVAARYLLQSLRPNDIVALGAGRGVGSTIEAMRRIIGDRSFPDLHLLSLSGGGLVRSKADRLDPFIDADEAIKELSVELGVRPSQVFRVHVPIVLADRDRVVASVAPHVSNREWDPRPPDIALMGLGILNPGHNIMMMAPQVISAISQVMRELEKTVLSENSDSVVDICNTFFVRRGVLSEETEREANRLVGILNSKIVTVPLRRINEAREKIVVGAGMEKLPVWLEMLQNGEEIGFRPTVIVTDEITGNKLIECLAS